MNLYRVRMLTVVHVIEKDSIMESKVRILVVEDHVISQRIAYFVLQSLHCQTDYANTGQKALALIKRNNYDLILMDLGLPDMNGIEAAKAIRELKSNMDNRIPIVALTAHTSASYDSESMGVEIDYFLEKPLMTENVLMLLKKFVPHKYRSTVNSMDPDDELTLEMDDELSPNLKIVGGSS